ncbi:MAG: thiol:disulfide interchange protein DsbA/DsbL [Gammaproteobacteria bacterium]|nr:thiol:disulfide interchange protein DsbA/DsbL [Gammaproteobacteria bacterium]
MKNITSPLLAAIAIFALGLVGTSQLMAAEGYELITPPQPTTSGDQVEVVELFWYGCPHCYRLEPFVERWLQRKPANVKFVRMPGVFRDSWEIHARAYYTAEILNVVDKVHRPMFEAIHEQKRRMDDEASIMGLFNAQGVSSEDFKRVFHSFAVETKLRRAKDMGQRYGAKGVPALIVNGKYRTGAQEAGGNAKVFTVVNQLVKQEGR